MSASGPSGPLVSLFGPVNDDSLSIAFRELYPIGAAAILQGKTVDCKRNCVVCVRIQKTEMLFKMFGKDMDC